MLWGLVSYFCFCLTIPAPLEIAESIRLQGVPVIAAKLTERIHCSVLRSFRQGVLFLGVPIRLVGTPKNGTNVEYFT